MIHDAISAAQSLEDAFDAFECIDPEEHPMEVRDELRERLATFMQLIDDAVGNLLAADDMEAGIWALIEQGEAIKASRECPYCGS